MCRRKIRSIPRCKLIRTHLERSEGSGKSGETMLFENRDGILYEARDGKPSLKICTAFEIEDIVHDATNLLWGYNCWALDIDDHLVRFRLEAGDFFGHSVVRVEQKFAFAGLHIWNPELLIHYLRQVPAMEPRVVNDLRISETDFNELASRRFRAAFEKTRAAA